MTEQTLTTSEPQNADAPSVGNVDAATQLVVDAQTNLGPAPNAGEPPATTEPTTSPDITGQPDGGVQQPDDQGKAKRMEQELAAQRKMLSSLGVNPDSEAVRQFNAGLISREELLGAPKVFEEQPKSAADKFNEHRVNMTKKIETGEQLTPADYLAGLEIQSEMVQENHDLKARGDREVLIDRCINAASAVIANDELHKTLPTNIQEIETQFFVASTDSVWGVATGGDQSKVTPENYNYYAQQNLNGPYQKLRNALIEHGRLLERGTPPTTPTPTQSVVPLSTHTGSGPAVPHAPIVKLDNLQEAARNYAKQRKAVV